MKKEEGEGTYLDTDHLEPDTNDEELWISANMLVNEVGYTFDQIVGHLGVESERLRSVINKKMKQRSDNIKKSYDDGELKLEEFEKAIEEIQTFSKKVGSLK